MIRRQPRYTRTDTLLPDTTLCRSPRPLLRPASSRNPGELGAEADRERDRKILRQHRGYDGHGPRPPDRGDRFVVEIGDAGAGRHRCDKDVTIAVDQELHHHDARAALTGFRLNALTKIGRA